jgi:betaine-aldehyde dehydrogenase
MREYLLYIGGEFVPSVSKETYLSINPWNQEPVARVARANAEDARRAIAAARKAFDEGQWPRMTKEERGALIKAVSDKINERKVDLEKLEVDDSGSTLRKAKEDVFLSARAMNYFSKLAAAETSGPIDGLSRPGFSRNILQREPVGVVGAITPWNFPLKMAVSKLGPALAAGNTVVLKPSEITPVTAMELAQIFHDAGFPKGVETSFRAGRDAEKNSPAVRCRQDLLHRIDLIGKRVMGVAAESLKKCTLECGGKSAISFCRCRSRDGGRRRPLCDFLPPGPVLRGGEPALPPPLFA